MQLAASKRKTAHSVAPAASLATSLSGSFSITGGSGSGPMAGGSSAAPGPPHRLAS